MAKLFLKKNEDKRIRRGHLWVFSNEVLKIEGEAENGDVVSLCDAKGSELGKGFYNKNSLITLRLLNKSFNGDFYSYSKQMILNALNTRKIFYPKRNSYRLIFSESDFMPGLIIDKYNDSYVLQVYSYGMEKNIGSLENVLINELKAKNIFTKNEPYFRKLEGLPEKDKTYIGEISSELIDDGKIKYKIDFSKSQKTGFYLDQSDNREFIERIVSGKSVLDAFCNSGGFGLHAAYSGAESVTFIDSSETEIENAKSNFELNSFKTQAEFITVDVFNYLEKCIKENKKFDVVIIDPPAFAKSRKSIPTAIKGYVKLNRLALSIVNEGGFLASSSCSHHVKHADFIEA
ncbi:MAG: class I SAM-dependent rRNA methyltransferase, partial [Chlorobi bacterium]|nr:class I SAM-dependent rRNA methyltransferase [Chlorobiota bacterium]